MNHFRYLAPFAAAAISSSCTKVDWPSVWYLRAEVPNKIAPLLGDIDGHSEDRSANGIVLVQLAKDPAPDAKSPAATIPEELSTTDKEVSEGPQRMIRVPHGEELESMKKTYVDFFNNTKRCGVVWKFEFDKREDKDKLTFWYFDGDESLYISMDKRSGSMTFAHDGKEWAPVESNAQMLDIIWIIAQKILEINERASELEEEQKKKPKPRSKGSSDGEVMFANN